MSSVKTLLEERYILKRKQDLSYIKRWKVDDDSLEDVLHDAVVNCLRYDRGFVDGLPFDNWFQTILTNCVKRHLRIERRQGMSEEFQEEVHFIDETCNGNERGERLLELIIEEINLEKNENQEILDLYFARGYKLREIDDIVEPSYDSIRGVVKRFTAKMREKYDQECLGC